MGFWFSNRSQRIVEVIPIAVLGFLACFSCSGPLSDAQSFLNPLAVLLGPRPQWPTAAYPNTKAIRSSSIQLYPNTIASSPLLVSGASQQGILIAHPISHNNFIKPPQVQLPSAQSFSPVVDTVSGTSSINNWIAPAAANAFKPSTNFLYPTDPIITPSPAQITQTEEPGYNPSIYNIESTDFKTRETSKPLDFRPSPQLFGDHDSQLTDSIRTFHDQENFEASEAQIHPKYEGGFQPLGYNRYMSDFGHYHETLGAYNQDLWKGLRSNKTSPKFSKVKKTNTTSPPRQNRKLVSAMVSKSVVTTEVSVKESVSSTKSKVSTQNIHEKFSPGSSASMSSSELVEDWIKVKELKSLRIKPTKKFPVYKRRHPRPSKCEFHRYGFCSMDSHYPKSEVEKLASRCYALLTHIISPKISYGIPTAGNGTLHERIPSEKRPGQRGWSWRSYQGKPICDTLELTVSPAWAKDEHGDWTLILQTQDWKQEAQISICASSVAQCVNHNCTKSTAQLFQRTKCVQRFTAQRLAVLDPENQDRCPVVKQVYLPSACICLHDVTEERFHVSAGGESPFVLKDTPTFMNDTTFMVVTEKFSINEGSTNPTKH